MSTYFVSRSLCTARLSTRLYSRAKSLPRRHLTTISSSGTESLRRSYLYVPSSSQKMLDKSLTNKSDVIIYDLEDSVSPLDKESARQRLHGFLSNDMSGTLPHSHRIAVRLNALDTPHFQADIQQALRIPRHSHICPPQDPLCSGSSPRLAPRSTLLRGRIASRRLSLRPYELLLSIESARGLWNVGDIAAWTSEYGPTLGGKLSALLFAAEDFCADTAIVRTRSRQELLYARSRMVIAAKAFGLEAIDMVCVNYKDKEYLHEECVDGRRLGFTGKQAIHPDQVETIQTTFVPTEQEILRAARIVHGMERAHKSQKGAIGLDDGKGGMEMIDAPMLKQAEKIVHIAKAAGIKIPECMRTGVGGGVRYG